MPRATGSSATRLTRFAVRRAGAEDLDLVAVLFDAYRQFYGAASDLDSSRRFLAARFARDESVVLLASPDPPADGRTAEAAGFAQLYRSFSSVSLGAIVILNDLFVVPAWRRAGVACRLVEEAAACAARAGAVRLDLATQQTNAPALRLYRSLGFIPDTEFTHLSLRLGGVTRYLDPSCNAR